MLGINLVTSNWKLYNSPICEKQVLTIFIDIKHVFFPTVWRLPFYIRPYYSPEPVTVPRGPKDPEPMKILK